MILSRYVSKDSMICLPTPIEDYDIGHARKELSKVDISKKYSGNLAFAGDFSEQSDLVNLQYVLQEIWPLIRKKHPSMKLDILGNKIDRAVVNLCQQSEGVRPVVEVCLSRDRSIKHRIC